VHSYLSEGVVLEKIFGTEVSSSLVVLLLLRVFDIFSEALFFFISFFCASLMSRLDLRIMLLHWLDVIKEKNNALKRHYSAAIAYLGNERYVMRI
jgi:hypothetical protein